MKTITTIEAKKWIENAIEDELVFGIRGDDFCPTDNFENSKVWDDGVKQEEELDGLCALKVWDESYIDQQLRIAKKYGNNIYIIIGDSEDGGCDANEIIISNHIIYAKIID